jgi:hypothetical protein
VEIQNAIAVTVRVTKSIAEVTAYPEEVMVTISAEDGILTPDQARELAANILKAADHAGRLDWEEVSNGNLKLVERSA